MCVTSKLKMKIMISYIIPDKNRREEQERVIRGRWSMHKVYPGFITSFGLILNLLLPESLPKDVCLRFLMEKKVVKLSLLDCYFCLFITS